MDIGGKIRQIRKDQGMTQEQFAEQFSVTRQTVSNWENSKNYPDMETMRAISETYHISFDTLLKDDLELLNEIDQTKKKAVVWKKKYNVVLAILIAVLGLCMVLGYQLSRTTGMVSWERIPEREYPLDKQAIADVIVKCGFTERNWTINQNDAVQFEGEEAASFTILSDHPEVRLGRVMSILSRQIGEERSLGLVIESLEENVAVLPKECEEAIIFGTHLFGGFSGETRVSDMFMKEFDMEEAIEWEQAIEGNVCRIQYDPNAYGANLMITFVSDEELLNPKDRVVSEEEPGVQEEVFKTDTSSIPLSVYNKVKNLPWSELYWDEEQQYLQMTLPGEDERFPEAEILRVYKWYSSGYLGGGGPFELQNYRGLLYVRLDYELEGDLLKLIDTKAEKVLFEVELSESLDKIEQETGKRMISEITGGNRGKFMLGEEIILEFTPGYRIDGLGNEVFYDEMPRLQAVVTCEFLESGGEEYQIGEISVLEP